MEQNVMTVKTRYGTVDETALQAFLDDFDTSSILQAVSNLDRVAYGIGQMQEELRNLYRMSEELMADGMNETGHEVPDSESIWMLAEDISTAAWKWSMAGSH
ncbi:hypothetical protein [Klebsiella pneumoniae]|uniref:hypothetical protein n=1 Tax=Klebsiella pneumoniae TaxID=573 RepID=UPI0027394F6E|nr:hypothetical protein [Klebsiella pneumoniae]